MAESSIPGGFSLVWLTEVGSTNDEAKRLAEEGAAGNTIVWAGEQTAGRGRSGRSWESLPGNLFVSLLVRPEGSAVDALPLSFIAGLAAADAVSAHVEDPGVVTCKWPNDVLIDGRKAAGLLLEAGNLVSGRLDYVVVGFGINIVSHPPLEGLLFPATSLHAEGAVDATDVEVLSELCRSWTRWRDRLSSEGFGAIREAWLERAYGQGQTITVRLPEGDVGGVFRDLDEDGALLLETEHGQRRILAGDVLAASPSELP